MTVKATKENSWSRLKLIFFLVKLLRQIKTFVSHLAKLFTQMSVIHSVLPCFIGLFIPALELIFLPRALLQKCVLQQLLFCTSRYAINSSVKVIQAVVSLLSSLFLPTIVAWKRAQARPYYVVASGLGSEEEVSGPNLVRNEA